MGAANFTFTGILKDDTISTVTSGISLITTQQKSEGGDDVEKGKFHQILSTSYLRGTVPCSDGK